MEMYLNTNFLNIENDELDSINGGGVVAIIIAGGVCLVGGFSLGYGLASWLG